jgi:hypothetical protein
MSRISNKQAGEIYSKNLEGRSDLRDSLDGRKMLKCILNK